MKKIFAVSFFLMICYTQQAQIRSFGRLNGLNQSQVDSLQTDEFSVKLSGKTHYTDYKVISYDYDTTFVDTTLTIKKHYAFNFLRKDNFERLPFHNQGQTFTNLAYDFRSNSLMYPDIGFRAKQFNYMNINDICYYHVPTPTTEIMYRTGQEQGQVLDAFFTLNFSKNLNVSIAYKGLRSLGYYRRSLVSAGNFRTTLSYQTPQNCYAIRAHVTSQDFEHQESGGLTPLSLAYFVNNNPNFTNRARLDVHLIDAQTHFEGTRVYVDHNYKIFSSNDTIQTGNFTNLKVGHELIIKNKTYGFNQATITTDFFGETDVKEPISDQTSYKFVNHQAYLEFNSKYVLGRFKVKANYTTVSYGYDDLLNDKSKFNTIKLKGKAASMGATWRAQLGQFRVNADATIVPGSGHLAGNYINAEAVFEKDSLFTVKGTLSQVSKSPDFNTQLFQSTYTDYNWKHNFVNVDTRNLGGTFESKWLNASLDFTNIEDYVYFTSDNRPEQYKGSITYLKLKANKEFVFGKFTLDNTLMYQKVTSGSTVFRVPDFVTRNTFYYVDDWFKGNPLLVNIGLTLKHFTKYKMHAYNPLLSDFTLQNDTEIGYPTVDFFFNVRVRRTRIFFNLENISSFIGQRNYFSAPNYPYRDFSIRFGLVWNWFI